MLAAAETEKTSAANGMAASNILLRRDFEPVGAAAVFGRALMGLQSRSRCMVRPPGLTLVLVLAEPKRATAAKESSRV